MKLLIPLGICPEVVLLDQMQVLFLLFLSNLHTDSYSG
jgi:hypothetical protein